MILIAHRGNTFGSKPELENKPDYLQAALDSGFEIEADVWFISGSFYLGHDKPEYKTSVDFLTRDGIWCHAKNSEAIFQMSQDNNFHYFWHEEDRHTITSRGIIWNYPTSLSTAYNSVCVMPENNNNISSFIVKNKWVCSDFVQSIRERVAGV